MIGLKRVLFPASSPDSSIDIINRGDSKRARTVHREEPILPSAHRKKWKNLRGNKAIIADGGILSHISEKSRNEATRQRLQRESRHTKAKRTSNASGSVLMNMEKIERRNPDARYKKSLATKEKISRSSGLSMDSLVDVRISSKHDCLFGSVVNMHYCNEKMMSVRFKKNNRLSMQNILAPKRIKWSNTSEANVNTLVAYSTKQSKSVTNSHPSLSVFEIAPLTNVNDVSKKTMSKEAHMTTRPQEQQSKAQQQFIPRHRENVNTDENRTLDKENNQPPTDSNFFSIVIHDAKANIQRSKVRDLVSPHTLQLVTTATNTVDTSSLNKIATRKILDNSPPATFLALPLLASSGGKDKNRNANALVSSHDLGVSCQRKFRHEISIPIDVQNIGQLAQDLSMPQKLELSRVTPGKHISDCHESLMSEFCLCHRRKLAPALSQNSKHIMSSKNKSVYCTESGVKPGGNIEVQGAEMSTHTNKTKKALRPLRRRSTRLSKTSNTSVDPNVSSDEQIVKQQGKSAKVNDETKNSSCHVRRSKRQRSKPLRFGYSVEREAQPDIQRGSAADHCATNKSNSSIGSNVRKKFGSLGWFDGKVVSVDAQNGFYKIQYEDGDREDVNGVELKAICKNFIKKYGKMSRIIPHDRKSYCDETVHNIVLEVSVNEQKDKIGHQSAHLYREEEDMFSATPRLSHASREDTTIVETAIHENHHMSNEENKDCNATSSQVQRNTKESTTNGLMLTEVDAQTSFTNTNLKKKEENSSRPHPSHKNSVQNKRGPNHIKRVNKPVRITNDSLIENQPWNSFELDSLINAHKAVDPRLPTFWEDVSKLVMTKSPVECIEHWYSLAKTPVGKKTIPKKIIVSSDFLVDGSQFVIPGDDIFNATPMKGILESNDLRNDNYGLSLGHFERMSEIVDGSAIKATKPPASYKPDHGEQYPQGYKTYIRSISRNIMEKDQRPKTKLSLKTSMPLQERANNGDIEMKCHLSPGGTLQFRASSTDVFLEFYERES
jgi:hypothetical protein